MAQHIVTSFEDDLQALARSIAEMGGRAEDIVERSITRLLKSDADLALPGHRGRHTGSTSCTVRSRKRRSS